MYLNVKVRTITNFECTLSEGNVQKGDFSASHSRVAIWPFLKLFARNKIVWPFGHFFWPFLNVEENSIF